MLKFTTYENRKILFILIAICLSCGKPDVATPKLAVWFFGDSITYGYGATATQNRWTSKLCIEKNWVENNSGVPGETLLQASENTGLGSFFARYKRDIPTKPGNGKYIFISYGVNDCAFNFDDYTTSLFSTQLQTVITYANSKGWANGDIVVLCGYFATDSSWENPYAGQALPYAANMARYNSFIAAAQRVSQNNPGIYFINPFNAYNATQLYDNIHPNDAGYLAMAIYIASQLPE